MSASLILVYHRVVEGQADPWSLCVGPRNFAEHAEVLARYQRPIRLQQMVAGLREGTCPTRSVAVTFDDGYVDNLWNAKPLLERHGIPATVFVVSGYVGQEREFWWDTLERVFLLPACLPAVLRLSIQGRKYEWKLGKSARYSEEAWRRHRSWRAWETDAPTTRHHTYRSVRELLMPLRDDRRREVLDQLLTWAGCSPAASAVHRALLPQELLSLAQGGVIEIGAHTVTHPLLSTRYCQMLWMGEVRRRSPEPSIHP